VPLEPLVGRSTAVTDDLRRMHLHALVVAGVLVAIEAVGLAAGWSLLTRGAPDWPEIYPYTVGGLAALTAAMALFRQGGRVAAWCARALAGVTLLLGAGVEVGVSAGVLPSSDPAGNDAVTWVTALPSVATLAVAVSVLLIGLGGPATARVRFWLAAAGGLVSLLGLLSYLYGSAQLFTGLGLTGISLPTTVIGLVVIAAAMTAAPDRPPLASLDARYDRSLMRGILPTLLVAPFLPAAVEWLVLRTEPDAASAAAVSGLVTVVLLVTVIALIGGAASRAQRELTTQRSRVWDAFEHTPAATAIVTIDGRIATANSALSRLTRRPLDELNGMHVADLVIPQDAAWVTEALAHVGAGNDGFRRDARLTGPGRDGIWIDLGVAPVRTTGGGVSYLILQCTDLTDRKKLERVLAEQATRDPLTGLLNRQGLDRRIDDRLAEKRPGELVVIVYADVDRLKPLNDTSGHAAGDELLREVSRRLRRCTRDEDILARVGGDEFVIVSTVPASDPDAVDAVMSRLRSELSGRVDLGSSAVDLSVSLGASVVDAGDDVRDAFADADRAMYQDKAFRRRATDAPDPTP
jgi:diguanylate cyclase (GGDEF)-like protein/PAS domain S-box-containing protein